MKSGPTACEGPIDPLTCGNHRVGHLGHPSARLSRCRPATEADQFAVTRGNNCPRVNSARSRSPAVELSRTDQRPAIAAFAATESGQGALVVVDRDTDAPECFVLDRDA